MMNKTVQIPTGTFVNLVKFFLAGIHDEEIEKEISDSLENKLDAIAKRELYSKYKNHSLTDDERKKARIEYLNKIGIPESFRW